ncbi:gluconokinase [Roseobacter sp. HKCCA0434]|uniref:gluconokinase n=1 Tax=Roseobacter sp. HKCCA0434 TaxID=3079297 RepID=UPI0029059A93|nr:gluconokinase [Roseobacter sp. HKCCA0434]
MGHVLVMGVCGVGKSTIGRGVADALDRPFVEADEFHPRDNIAHMSAGRPLTDAMRAGWLDNVAEAAQAAGTRSVIACSALKRSYRERLEARLGPLTVVFLHGTRALLVERMSARQGHFMPVSLLDSQFADLEPPEGPRVLPLDLAQTPEAIVAQAQDFARSVETRSVEHDDHNRSGRIT